VIAAAAPMPPGCGAEIGEVRNGARPRLRPTIDEGVASGHGPPLLIAAPNGPPIAAMAAAPGGTVIVVAAPDSGAGDLVPRSLENDPAC
jgi:hypothetical protein